MRTRLSLAAAVAALVGTFMVPHAALGLGGHHARVAQHQRFIGLGTNPKTGTPSAVLGFGAIHARGTDKVISGTKDKFVFPKGSITVVHTRKTHHQSADKTTCYFTEHESGTFKITGGTRAYAGASGSGSYTASVNLVGCSRTKPPSLFMIQIHAAGSVTL
jgi:hypothetical protein